MIIKKIEDLESIPEVVIIGGGVSAISIALILEEYNTSCLIIEAGPSGPEITETSQSYYNGKLLKDEYFDLKETRVRKFGGSSEHWEDSVTLRPLDEYDLKDWLIKKQDLDQFTEKAREIFRVKQDTELKDLLLNDSIRYTDFMYSLPKKPKRHEEIQFGKKFYNHISESQKIILVPNTQVLSLDGNNKVENIYYASDNKIKSIRPNITILATGGIENSRILLYSQKISKNNFLKNLTIGKKWMEHITGLAIGSFVGSQKKLELMMQNIKKKLDYNATYFSLTDEALFRLNILNVLLKFQKDKISSSLIINLKKIIEKIDFLIKPIMYFFNLNYPSNIKLIAMVEQKPMSDNFIKLSENKSDPNKIPEPELCWNWKNQEEIKLSLNKSIDELNKFSLKEKIGKIIPNIFLRNKMEEYPKDTIYAGHHHLGGTQMSETSKEGVVDKDLKVFDVDNLFITGGSVFPTGGYVHPTFTIVQLSIRLAHHIQKKYIINAKENKIV